jgi:hypothetical protein
MFGLFTTKDSLVLSSCRALPTPKDSSVAGDLTECGVHWIFLGAAAAPLAGPWALKHRAPEFTRRTRVYPVVVANSELICEGTDNDDH